MRATPVLTMLFAAGTVLATCATAEVVVNGKSFDSYDAYWASDYAREQGRTCGTPAFIDDGIPRGATNCTINSTTITTEYDPPNQPIVEIPVVVHVITNSTGTQGNLSQAIIESQIDVLNEDFQAMMGSNGEEGTNTRLQFVLAGQTLSANDTWFNDSGTYYNSLAWDPNVYLNIYSNNASGALGYVPFLPQSGPVGSNADRVVVYWRAFGRPAPFFPYDLGRSGTHEVGHYLGLHHTFNGGCGIGTVPGCYTSGDYICDTESESGPEFNCPVGSVSCGTADPVHNYMDYSTDACMNQFTPEQANRIRCTLANYRPNLGEIPVAVGDPIDGPQRHLLAQNRPNPFNPTTEISFRLDTASDVSLVVMDVSGRIIRTLTSGALEAGEHRVSWDGTNDMHEAQASGVYFYRLNTAESSQTRRMILLK